MRELWDVYNEDYEIIDGKTATRGKHDLENNEYHLVVYVWIINCDNRTVITKRQKGKSFGGSWECTGGCAKQGDTSLMAAIREVKEELGLILKEDEGELYMRYKRNYPERAKAICDVWVFRHDFNESDLILQKSEVSEAKVVSFDELKDMFSQGVFGNRYKYINRLIEKYCPTIINNN